MAGGPMDGSSENGIPLARTSSVFTISLDLSADELAAVEGWRTANNLPSVSHAIRELTRLGLLSEISQIYSVVQSVRRSIDRDLSQ